jgi:hypothetical protein
MLLIVNFLLHVYKDVEKDGFNRQTTSHISPNMIKKYI